MRNAGLVVLPQRHNVAGFKKHHFQAQCACIALSKQFEDFMIIIIILMRNWTAGWLTVVPGALRVTAEPVPETFGLECCVIAFIAQGACDIHAAGWFTLVPGMLGAAGGPLLETFRTGLGFDFDAIGDDMLCGLGRYVPCISKTLAIV